MTPVFAYSVAPDCACAAKKSRKLFAVAKNILPLRLAAANLLRPIVTLAL